jgi:hypothetical protein
VAVFSAAVEQAVVVAAAAPGVVAAVAAAQAAAAAALAAAVVAAVAEPAAGPDARCSVVAAADRLGVHLERGDAPRGALRARSSWAPLSSAERRTVAEMAAVELPLAVAAE